MSFLCRIWQKIFPTSKGGLGSAWRAFIDRAPRLRTRELNAIRVELQGHEPRLANISASGMGFERSSFTGQPALGRQYEAVVYVQESSVQVLVEISRLTESLVGCRVVDGQAELARLFSEQLQTEMAGAQMSTVDARRLQRAKGDPYWFRAPDGSELFVVCDANGILHLELRFLGHLIERAGDGSLRVARQRGGAKGDYSAEVMEPVAFSAHIKEQAQRFLSGVEGLPPHLMQEIVQQLAAA